MKKFFLHYLFLFVALISAGPAFAGITVNSPANNAQVSSPFTVSAHSTTCQSLPTAAMAYSLDNQKDTIEPSSFTATATASLGAHVLHVKCWGKGTFEETNLNVNIVQATNITVSRPADNATEMSPFPIQASVTMCGGVPAVSMGYSFDSQTATIEPTTFSVSASVNPGAHTLHIKCWGKGAHDEQLLSVNVLPTPTPVVTGPPIPDYAQVTSMIQTLPNWRIKHDPGTPGSADGSMTLVSDPALSGQAAKFYTTYSDWGGVLYSNSYYNDPSATNFVYDAEVWIASGSTIANLEMDNNQVTANGDTIIYAFQCAGASGLWEYTENAGTRTQPQAKWLHSAQACNPATWAKDTWHHVQIWTSRDDSGNVTYHSVWLDGVEAPINHTVNSDFALGWAAGVLVLNFQVDDTSATGASSTLYVDNLKMYRW